MTSPDGIFEQKTNSQLGADISGSLPNISGTFGSECLENGACATTSMISGAFSISTNSNKHIAQIQTFYEGKNHTRKFTASNSNSVYAASAGKNVVRPTSSGVTMWKRTV